MEMANNVESRDRELIKTIDKLMREKHEQDQEIRSLRERIFQQQVDIERNKGLNEIITQLERDKAQLERDKSQLKRDKSQLEREKSQLKLDKSQLERDNYQLQGENDIKNNLLNDKKQKISSLWKWKIGLGFCVVTILVITISLMVMSIKNEEFNRHRMDQLQYDKAICQGDKATCHDKLKLVQEKLENMMQQMEDIRRECARSEPRRGIIDNFVGLLSSIANGISDLLFGNNQRRIAA